MRPDQTRSIGLAGESRLDARYSARLDPQLVKTNKGCDQNAGDNQVQPNNVPVHMLRLPEKRAELGCPALVVGPPCP
jgi:hypothetical protein